jgi:tight adherence protein B
MTRLASYQIAAACLALIVPCVAALPFLRADQRNRKLQARIGDYASPHARATTIGLHERTNAGQGQSIKRVLRQALARLVAFNPAHRDNYPLPWWVVLPVALLLSRIVVIFAQSLLGTFALLAVPVLWIVLVRQFYCWCEHRRNRTLFEQFPDALAMLVRSVRVGIPIIEGIRGVATDSAKPTAPEFALVVDQIALGVTLEEALHGLATRNKVAEYGFFATALGLQAETGGTVGDTLERLADVIRKRVALREHARALASEARTSIGILAALPVFTGGALALITPDYINTLFFDPQGRRIFTMAIVSFSLGIVTMQSIVKRSLS